MIRNTAVTVCGPLNVNKLGVTYVHEHLMVKPQLPDEYYIPYTLDDEAASTEETRSFSAAGGETLVEMTPIKGLSAHCAGYRCACHLLHRLPQAAVYAALVWR